MDDRVERLRKILAEQYGINSDEELLEALERQKPINIGVFVGGLTNEKSA